MALFKNLYLDLGFLNPFKKKKSEEIKVEKRGNKEISTATGKAAEKKKHLPSVSKKLLDEKVLNKEEVDHGKGKKELPDPLKRKFKGEISNGINQPPKISSFNKKNTTSSNMNSKNTLLKNQDTSYFKNLYSNLIGEGYPHSKIREGVIDNNLLSGMQDFWTNKKTQLKTTEINEALKRKLSRKINDLQEQEIEWQRLQMQHEQIRSELESKEILIENNIRELKKAFKKVHLYLDVEDSHHFVLKNGKRIRNLHGLMQELKMMDDDVFNHHVNEDGNHFANWIRDVMGHSELAEDVLNSGTRQEMIDNLERWHY